ncbi:MAG: hypothetical protein M0Z31_08000 [Clostridia bacterium]|nr:hypothetical protein [Clostridia bacterium]
MSIEKDKQIINLVALLERLVISYKYLVSGADEFNRITKKTPPGAITKASRVDVKKAIDRAADLGEIVDEVIDVLDKSVKSYLEEMKAEKPE